MKKWILSGIIIFLSAICWADSSVVLKEIQSSAANKKLTLAFSIYDFQTGQQIGQNESMQSPMQSVFKLPIGIMALDKVDKKELSLSQSIIFTKANLLPKTWSPIREKYPNGTTLTLRETLDYTIAKSDNNSCDVLLEMLGGPKAVEAFFKSRGISGINVEVNEVQMNAKWENKRKNWITPKCTISLLQKIHRKELLSKEGYEKLWEIMTNTRTGSFRRNIPESVIIGNKTGASGHQNGESIATNDVGIMTLPNGRSIAFSIFVLNSHETAETNYDLIVDIAKIIYENW